MTVYRCRPGVLLVEICGEYLLVAAEEARSSCPYVRQINRSAAFLWKRLMRTATAEDLENAIFEAYKVRNADVRKDIAAFLKDMTESGYILGEDGIDNKNEGDKND